MALEQLEEIPLLDAKTGHVVERQCRCRERRAFVDGDGRQRVARPEDLENDFLAGGRRLVDLDPTLDDGQKRRGLLAFVGFI